MSEEASWNPASGCFQCPINGLDHRVGHFRPLRIMGVTPNLHVLNGLEASTWDRSSWGGRRRDQGLGPLFQILFFPSKGKLCFLEFINLFTLFLKLRVHVFYLEINGCLCFFPQ